jgi:hypothetical protein
MKSDDVRLHLSREVEVVLAGLRFSLAVGAEAPSVSHRLGHSKGHLRCIPVPALQWSERPVRQELDLQIWLALCSRSFTFFLVEFKVISL